MRAIVYDRYGGPEVLRVADVPLPSIGPNDILIRIAAVSLNRSDWEWLTGRPLYARLGGLSKPRRHILGSDIAGTVEAVGDRTTLFRPGDEVFGDIMSTMGGFAEHAAVPGHAIAIKPPELTFEEASTIPQAGVIALQAMRGRAQPGRRVLINGAGGGTGAFAIQLATMYGADVTAVDNTAKLDLMRSLGARHVIDYTREDFTKRGERYDLILDLVARRSPFAYMRALQRDGVCLLVGGSTGRLLQSASLGPLLRRITHKRVGVLVVKPNRADLEEIGALCASKRIRIVIDRVYTLPEVPDALQRLGEDRALGKLVVTVPT